MKFLILGDEFNSDKVETPAAEQTEDISEGELFGTEELSKEWQDHMGDFEPSDIMSFKLDAGVKEVFAESVLIMNSYIRGVFFSTADYEAEISFYVHKAIILRFSIQETKLFIMLNQREKEYSVSIIPR